MGVFFGLMSAVCWGTADFFATHVTRRLGALRALACTQALSLLAIGAIVFARGDWPAATNSIWLTAATIGVVHFGGTQCLYRAFQIGTLSIAAPIASSYAVITALLAWLGGERPAPAALAGAALLVLGVMIVTRGHAETVASPRGIPEAIGSAFCFGTVFWALGFVTPALGLFWPLLMLRLVTVAGAALILGALWLRHRHRAETMAAQTVADETQRPLWPLVVAVTTCDTLAWLAFNAGARTAFVTIVTALSALFGAVTVLLAWLFLHERLSRAQWLGVAIILGGILLVSV